jgi:HEPN domain-containing protein
MRQEAEMNADLLYRMASGFHKVGIDAAWQLRGTGSDAFRMIGPSAVNLALATELYLKAIYLLNARRPPGVHELWKLFSALPIPTIELLNKEYTQVFATTDDQLKSIHMVVARVNEEEKKDFPQKPDTIEILLKCHNHAFISWRYLHEFSGKGTAYHFDYHAMHVFCVVLNSHIASLLTKRLPHFSMQNVSTEEPV